MPATIDDLLSGLGPLPAHVLGAVRSVPRHHFVAEIFRGDAYKDAPLPIGGGRTTSRPSIILASVAALGSPKRVLEVGTGCGWQAAILSRYAEVFSIEIDADLHERAARDLAPYGVHLRHGDGMKGWPEEAPFDGIIVCASVAEPSSVLLSQLSNDGVMVAQIGNCVVSVRKDGSIKDLLGPGRFVPALTE